MKKTNWAEILQANEERSVTLAEFAKSKGVSKAALSYQIRQRNKSKAKFISVTREPEVKLPSVTIEFPSGIRITVQQ